MRSERTVICQIGFTLYLLQNYIRRTYEEKHTGITKALAEPLLWITGLIVNQHGSLVLEFRSSMQYEEGYMKKHLHGRHTQERIAIDRDFF